MKSEGELIYYLLLYINPNIIMYIEVLLSSLLLFSECSKIYLLLKFEFVNLPQIIYKAKLKLWRKIEVGIITAILFLQMLDMNVITFILFLILAYEFYIQNFCSMEESLMDNLQFKKIEVFVKFICYLMSVYFCTVQILINTN